MVCNFPAEILPLFDLLKLIEGVAIGDVRVVGGDLPTPIVLSLRSIGVEPSGGDFSCSGVEGKLDT